MTASASACAPLREDVCRDRLAGSRRCFLACTHGGLPTVVPARLKTQDGRLLICAGEADKLVGQVVALTVGRNAFRFCRGWSVTARGRLGELLPDGSLPMEIATLEGATVVHPAQRTYA